MVPKTYKAGDRVTVIHYSDRSAYEVVSQSRGGKRLAIRRLKATLLNPAGSAAPDALTFTPGGFVGHTAGEQRYSYESQPDAAVVTAAWSAKRGSFRLKGERLVDGASEHYDFNF
jgi:hypothetical protein